MLLHIYHSTGKLVHQLLTLKEGREIQTQLKKSSQHGLDFESYVAKNTNSFIAIVSKTGLGNHRFKAVSQLYPNSYGSFVSYIMATDFPAIQSSCLTHIQTNIPGQSDCSVSSVLHEGAWIISRAVPNLVCQKVPWNSPCYQSLTKLSYTPVIIRSMQIITLLIL